MQWTFRLYLRKQKGRGNVISLPKHFYNSCDSDSYSNYLGITGEKMFQEKMFAFFFFLHLFFFQKGPSKG